MHTHPIIATNVRALLTRTSSSLLSRSHSQTTDSIESGMCLCVAWNRSAMLTVSDATQVALDLSPVSGPVLYPPDASQKRNPAHRTPLTPHPMLTAAALLGTLCSLAIRAYSLHPIDTPQPYRVSTAHELGHFATLPAFPSKRVVST